MKPLRLLSRAILALGLAGCAHGPTIAVRPASNARGTGQPRILYVPPMVLATPQDAVVRVVGPDLTCSGTLVDDDLVLTAHHCVVKRGPAVSSHATW